MQVSEGTVSRDAALRSPGADIRLCSKPVLRGSRCLAQGGGSGADALGSWPHWLDCKPVGSKWLLAAGNSRPLSSVWSSSYLRISPKADRTSGLNLFLFASLMSLYKR